jgi:hypothetical protein
VTDYQRQNRPDLAVLHALSQSPDRLFLRDLEIQVRANEEWISASSISDILNECVFLGYVIWTPDGGAKYAITSKGRAHLCAADARAIFGERVPAEPIKEAVQSAIEMRAPATALICVNEDELDDWWEPLSVEQKAECFAGFALHELSGSHAYVKGESVLVAGLVGDLSPDLTEKLRNTESEAAR